MVKFLNSPVMSPFETYIRLGFEHIADLDGADHMLFLLALIAVYSLRDWKKLLILVTAFTIGHSVTLALAALKIVAARSEVIEFLIPLSIFIMALGNVVPGTGSAGRLNFKYGLALGFGLIHGLGFSNYFRTLLGREADIVWPLLGFNLGLEIGQLAIVGVILILFGALHGLFGVKQRDWSIAVSGAALWMSLLLMWQNKFW